MLRLIFFNFFKLSDVIYNSDLANESSGHDNPFAEYPVVKITKNGNNIKVFMTADYYNSTYFKNWGNFSNARYNYPILLSDRKNPEVEISGTVRGFDLPGLTITLDTTASSINDFYNVGALVAVTIHFNDTLSDAYLCVYLRIFSMHLPELFHPQDHLSHS